MLHHTPRSLAMMPLIQPVRVLIIIASYDRENNHVQMTK
jgi:hypothetical protein